MSEGTEGDGSSTATLDTSTPEGLAAHREAVQAEAARRAGDSVEDGEKTDGDDDAGQQTDTNTDDDDGDDGGHTLTLTTAQKTWATQLGISAELIAAPTPELVAALDQLGTTASKKLAELGRRDRALSDREAALNDGGGDGDDDGGDGGSTTEPDADFLRQDFLDEDWADDTGVAKINNVLATMRSTLEDMAVMRQQFDSFIDDRNQHTLEDFLGGLDAATFPELGLADDKGNYVPSDALDPDGDNYRLRDALSEKAFQLQAAHRAATQEMLPFRQALDQAKNVLYAEQIAKAAEAKGAKRGADRTRKRIARPSARYGARTDKEGRDAIADRIARRARAKGIPI